MYCYNVHLCLKRIRTYILHMHSLHSIYWCSCLRNIRIRKKNFHMNILFNLYHNCNECWRNAVLVVFFFNYVKFYSAKWNQRWLEKSFSSAKWNLIYIGLFHHIYLDFFFFFSFTLFNLPSELSKKNVREIKMEMKWIILCLDSFHFIVTSPNRSFLSFCMYRCLQIRNSGALCNRAWYWIRTIEWDALGFLFRAH